VLCRTNEEAEFAGQTEVGAAARRAPSPINGIVDDHEFNDTVKTAVRLTLMSTKNEVSTEETPACSGTTGDPVERRAYAPPVLMRFGDVRSVTLGGSPGGGDSGNTFIQQPFSG